MASSSAGVSAKSLPPPLDGLGSTPGVLVLSQSIWSHQFGETVLLIYIAHREARMTAGNNDFGKLGLGDRADRGNTANEMGNFLPAVSFGTGVYIPPADTPTGNDDVPATGGDDDPPTDTDTDDVPDSGTTTPAQTPVVEIPVGTGGGPLQVDLSDMFPGLADVDMVTLNPTPDTLHPTP